MRATLDNEGRIALPEDVRRRLGMKPGDALEMQLEEDGLRFVPARPDLDATHDRDRRAQQAGAGEESGREDSEQKTGLHEEDGVLVWHGRIEHDNLDIVQFIKEMREERIRKQMGPL